MATQLDHAEIRSVAPSADEFLAAVRAQLPAIRARARETEDQRFVASANIEALARIGFYKMLQPAEFGGFDAYLWSFVDGKPLRNRWKDKGEVPASTPLSDRLSKELKKRGFRFVGTTICYSLMQATGMINDHLVGCFRHRECAALD